MATSINADNGAVSGSAGLKSSADSSGVLALQTNGTTAVSISAAQVVSYTNQPVYSGGTANGVAYLNGSKVLTTGSALAFDGTRLQLGTTSVINGGTLSIAASSSSDYQLSLSDTRAFSTAPSANIVFGGKFNTAGTNKIFGYVGGGKENTTDGNNAGYVAFGTASNGGSETERARLSSGGWFKASNFGTYQNAAGVYHEFRSNAADAIMYIQSTNASTPFGIEIDYTALDPNGTGNPFLSCYGTTTARAIIRSNGGLANYSANNVNLSDRREKTNFAPAKSYLDVICAIPVQTFNYIDQNLEEDGGLTLGVVAQDVQAVAPEMVMESNWGTKEEPKMRLSIYQTDLQYALMKCIQEQQALITQLQADVAALKGA